MNNQEFPPFSCTYTPNIPELLMKLNCTIAISTYQAGKLIFLSAINNESLIQLPRNFDKPMGIAVFKNKLAVAAREEVILMVNSPQLGKNYPKNPNTYDGLYLPRVTYHTGHIDIHDITWGTEGLWAVNTSFSCLVLIDENYSFTPKWQPPFIKILEHDDFCHLNGMAMRNGVPVFVSALGETTEPKGWKENITDGGIVMHVPSDEIILKGLAMPHSPRIYDNKLYMLLSAKGEIICIDAEKGTYEVVTKITGFVRGMTKYGDYLFIGRSLLRKTSTTFEKLQKLPIGKEALSSGVTVVHLPTGKIYGEINYQNSVEEIYDIQILPDLRRPGIINTETEEHKMAVSTPTQTYWAKW